MRWLPLLLLLACSGQAPPHDLADAPPEAAPPNVATTPSRAEKLQAALDGAHASAQGLGVVAAIVGQDGFSWAGAAGHADVARTRAMVRNDKVRIYSVTKTFTAALVLDLVDEKRLSLDDTLDTFYPGFTTASTVRVRHLLSHTSGLYEYLADPQVYAGRLSPWNPDDAIARAAAHPARFAAGASYEYCNTNYLVLGRIIEKVTGETYAHRLRARLLEPLALKDTYLEGFDSIPYTIVEGAVGDPSAPVFRERIVHPSLSWSAGAIQSGMEDVARWFDALFGGRVLSAESRAAMRTPPQLTSGASTRYGFGMAIGEDGKTFFHPGGGRTWDFQCFAGHADGTSVAVCSNLGPVAADAHARALWAVR